MPLRAPGKAGGARRWGLAYGHLGLVVLIGPLVLCRLRPRSLPGDQKAE